MLLEISGEITPERMKRRSQSKNNTKLWIDTALQGPPWVPDSESYWEQRRKKCYSGWGLREAWKKR